MMPSNRHGQVWSCGETVKTPFPQRQKWTKITLFCGVGSCPREMGFHYYLSTRSAEIQWAGCQPSDMTYSWKEAQRSTSEVTSDCLKHCTTGPQLCNLGIGGSNSVQSKIYIYLQSLENLNMNSLLLTRSLINNTVCPLPHIFCVICTMYPVFLQ